MDFGFDVDFFSRVEVGFRARVVAFCILPNAANFRQSISLDSRMDVACRFSVYALHTPGSN